MNTSLHYRMAGLGAGTQIMSTVGNTLLASAPYTGPAAPFVVIAGGIVDLLAAVGVGGGCGQTCIQATTFANQAEILLERNLNAYLALSIPRAQSLQQAALSNFQQVWDGLVYACAGVPGSAGQNCVSDRKAGACKLKDSIGNCWNWWTGYHDPIANDPHTYDDSASPITGTGAGAGVAAASTGIDPTLLLMGGALFVAFMVISS